MKRVLAGLLVTVVVAALAAGALATRGETLLASRADGPAGAAGDAGSGIARISADGRHVVFTSAATNLSDADGAMTDDVFLRDTETGTTTLVSRADGETGDAGNLGSDNAVVSADGRYVAFRSAATNLSSEDVDAVADIFVRDTVAQTTTLVSRASGEAGAVSNGESSGASISADGRYVAFTSLGDALSNEDDDTKSNVFVRDLQEQTTVLASRATGAAGPAASDHSDAPALSADGRSVAFVSQGDGLSDEDLDTLYNTFVRDLDANTTTLASRASGAGGEAASESSNTPALSADGGVVAFTSRAPNLVPGDANADEDIFVRDLDALTTELVSRGGGAGGAIGDDGSDTPSLSATGRFVLFESNANNLSDAEHEGALNVFVRDRVAQATTLVSRVPPGDPVADASSYTYGSGLSADGRYATFESRAGTLSSEDVDPVSDVFRFDHLGTPPSCTDATADVAHMSPTSVTLPCADADGDAPLREIVAGPAHGSLGPIDQAAGTVVYTPAAGYAGTDSFTFRAADVAGAGNVAAVRLTVAARHTDPGVCANLIAGTAAGDVLTGTAAGDRLRGRRGDDVLRGAAGDDCLGGGPGADRMRGGRGDDRLADRRGRDRFAGGAGDDRVDARDRRRGDRRRRDRITCGPGSDRVRADRRDRVASNCERVRRPPS